MLVRFVVADLVRNPRRTLSTMVGVMLGVGLFCGVLFFVDGLSASMTQRALEPLAIDMQRVVTERVGSAVATTQTLDPAGPLRAGERTRVGIEVANTGEVAANEVTIRSIPSEQVAFVAGSAEVDGTPIGTDDLNPLAYGDGQAGLNLGTVEPGQTRLITYLVEVVTALEIDPAGTDAINTTSSTRESVAPRAANQPPAVSLDQLAAEIETVPGVSWASPLSLADLGSDTITSGGQSAPGPTKILGFDAEYAGRNATIELAEGSLSADGAVLSAEAASALNANVGSVVTIGLPDDSTLDVEVSGIADLSRARALFSSRRGGDLETFIYSRNSVVVSPSIFEREVLPAYQRAAAQRGERLKNPPIREVDIAVDRDLLAADPATAALETAQIATEVTAVAAHQDYLLDNISNTLGVASADAEVAKRLFVFLGVPGGLLGTALAGYSGTVLAEAQRREQATLRVRGAGRRHLLRMLALRTALLTATGAIVGLAIGYVAAIAILGRESLERASNTSLLRSALIGTMGGLLATGLALYLTGRRSIDHEINEDRARLANRAPLWRRARLDIAGVAFVIAGTSVALRAHAFDGAVGSVYFGRSVDLNLTLLVLPIAVWLTGSLLAARVFAGALARSRPPSRAHLDRPFASLYRLSVGRRPWAVGNGAIIVSLIVALATSLAAFTASYDEAKIDDARFANGADIRITPNPTAERRYTVDDADLFQVDGVAATTPVVYGLSNVILRSERTSDPANLVAIDPGTYATVAPLPAEDITLGDTAPGDTALGDTAPGDTALGDTALGDTALGDTAFEDTALEDTADGGIEPTAILLSVEMAEFLQAKVGDTLNVLLARATEDQVEVELHITGLFERLPGFPDGADAVMSIEAHTNHVPTKSPDFFLAIPTAADDEGLQRAVDALQAGQETVNDLQIDTRATTLARDQSSLAALNIAGLVDLDSAFSLSMAVVTIAIFVFGLLLQRRREYVTLRAQGLEPRTVRLLIAAEAATVAGAGVAAGLMVGAAMGYYFVTVLRPLFVLPPAYVLPVATLAVPVGLVFVATIVSALAASHLVASLDPTELLRDE